MNLTYNFDGKMNLTSKTELLTGNQGGVYDFETFFNPRWWHFMYKIPRKW
jgi:hypothetical protein